MFGPSSHALLYIIGNGFDVHHGIPSKYSDFETYVKGKDPELHLLFEKFFSFDGNWANFEQTLGHLDIELIFDETSDCLTSYSSEDWSDADNHNFPDEVSRIARSLSIKLKRLFTEWACKLKIPKQCSYQGELLQLELTATYLSFNYTDTLQRLYGVPQAQILHIHNQALNGNSNLVLGHGWEPSTIPSLNKGLDLEAQDVRKTQANQILDDYFSATYKGTSTVIEAHSAFFKALSGIKCIRVLGHSMSEVDYAYFELIGEATMLSSPCWIVSYFGEEDKRNKQKTLQKLDISNVELRALENAAN
jgi:hypothetical protein